MERKVRDEFDNLVRGNTVLKRFLHVKRQFVGTVKRDEAGDSDKASIARGNVRASPDFSKENLICILCKGGRDVPKRFAREKLVADKEIRELWDAYEIGDPLVPNKCTIESRIGTFSYEALTLANPGETSGIVVQIPDQLSRDRLALLMDHV